MSLPLSSALGVTFVILVDLLSVIVVGLFIFGTISGLRTPSSGIARTTD
jgi:hypothetical protein